MKVVGTSVGTNVIDNVVVAATKRPRIGLIFDSVSREDWQVMRDFERCIFF